MECNFWKLQRALVSNLSNPTWRHGESPQIMAVSILDVFSTASQAWCPVPSCPVFGSLCFGCGVQVTVVWSLAFWFFKSRRAPSMAQFFWSWAASTWISMTKHISRSLTARPLFQTTFNMQLGELFCSAFAARVCLYEFVSSGMTWKCGEHLMSHMPRLSFFGVSMLEND